MRGPEQKHPIRKATFNVMNPRPSEVVGAGFFVFRRGERTNRIRPSLWPFEHGTLAEAVAQADALAAGQPGATFVVVQHAYAACTPAVEVAA